jgi:SurA N-terminal domain
MAPALGGIPDASKMALEWGFPHADVAQLVERELPKLEVAGSRPVVRFLARIAGSTVAVMALALAGWSATASADLPLPEELVPNTVVLVSEVPVRLGTVTKAEFAHALDLAAVVEGRRATPKPGRNGYGRLARRTVDSLLEVIWLKGQAAEMGISVTSRQVSRELALIKRQAFSSEAEYRQFMREVHYTRRDVRERVEAQLLAMRMQARILRGADSGAERNKAIRDFVTEFNQQWRARTVCAAGYVTDRCSNGPPPGRLHGGS